jgi:hypothetical protein
VKKTFPILSTAGPSVKIKPLPIFKSLASFFTIEALSIICPKEKWVKNILIKNRQRAK